jgi:SAM-dependent methyltransferase
MAVESTAPAAAGTAPGFRIAAPALATVTILVAHFASTAPWDVLVLTLFVFPIVFAAMSEERSAVLVILAPIFALSDDLIDADTLGLMTEIAVVGFTVLGGARLYRLTTDERAGHDRIIRETVERIARLRNQSGYWQAVAKRRMGGYATGIEERFILEVMRWRPGSIVLDVGSASGRLEHALFEYAGHVLATDIDHEEVYARTADEQLTPIVVSNLPALPVQDGCVDVVSAIEVPAASDEKWFRDECKRVLAPGGIVIVTAFNARSYKGMITRIMHRERSPWSGLYYQESLAEQLELWRNAGFEVVRKRGFYWSPLPRNSDSRWVDGWAAVERLLGLRGLTSLSPWVMLELRKRNNVENA